MTRKQIQCPMSSRGGAEAGGRATLKLPAFPGLGDANVTGLSGRLRDAAAAVNAFVLPAKLELMTSFGRFVANFTCRPTDRDESIRHRLFRMYRA
ncbi:MAG: hypothetical protein FWG56_09385 [Desulfovibrionaceae bacterium]|nr:hypothetical protein [Desulfovibrionaceae bacterium]